MLDGCDEGDWEIESNDGEGQKSKKIVANGLIRK